MNLRTKEVAFAKYCVKCKHFNEPEAGDTCNYCLANPSNEGSRKPVKYAPDDIYQKYPVRRKNKH